jgi:SH3 domain-containing YSC84-like protein 1
MLVRQQNCRNVRSSVMTRTYENHPFFPFLDARSRIQSGRRRRNRDTPKSSHCNLREMTETISGIRPDRIANADCIAVIPGFKKGAAGVGVGFGRGFISCRKDGGWSAPAAISIETASLGVQLGGEKIDVVMLSLDKSHRSKLLANRFTIGSDASAAWANGKSAHDNPNAQVVFYGQTEGGLRRLST